MAIPVNLCFLIHSVSLILMGSMFFIFHLIHLFHLTKTNKAMSKEKFIFEANKKTDSDVFKFSLNISESKEAKGTYDLEMICDGTPKQVSDVCELLRETHNKLSNQLNQL